MKGWGGHGVRRLLPSGKLVFSQPFRSKLMRKDSLSAQPVEVASGISMPGGIVVNSETEVVIGTGNGRAVPCLLWSGWLGASGSGEGPGHPHRQRPVHGQWWFVRQMAATTHLTTWR